MTEPQPDPPVAGSPSAGSLLRAAREKQGLHIAALATAIKVAPAKLDALEHGRYDELPDVTFTRALAQSVCRVLKIDARPVLALLPSSAGARLEKVDAGLHTPFRERAMKVDPSEWQLLRQPVFWLVVIMLVGAAAFWLWPARWSGAARSAASAGAAADTASRAPSAAASAAASMPAATMPNPAGAPAAAALSASAAADPAPVAVVETVHSAPAAGNALAIDPMPKSLLALRASEPSWVEVLDQRGQVLLSRTLQPGEAVGVDGELPLRVRIGNASATRLSFRGRNVDLGAIARDNVARVDLK